MRPPAHDLKRSGAILCGALIAVNLAAWGWALCAFRAYPVLMGTAALAYTLGLRHAIDADHIAAIDNVSRRLMRRGGKPIAVGLLFALGHSTVVVLGSIGIAVMATRFPGAVPGSGVTAGAIGAGVSALILIVLAVANLFVLSGIWRAFRRVRQGEIAASVEIAPGGPAGGVLTRLFGALFDRIGSVWMMYPLGMMFGLGFDTASEIGLLGISAVETARGMPLLSLLVFPALFTAGMCLLDTIDGLLMVAAYGWAFVQPVRKLYYNLTITAISVVVALLVGGVEALGVVAGALKPSGAFWRMIGALNGSFGLLGGAVIAVFACAWLIAMGIYRAKGFERLEPPPRSEARPR